MLLASQRPLAAFTLLLGAAATPLFSGGPPDSYAGNGPEYRNCTSCHTDFAAESGLGEVTVSGFPARFLPGQVYPLTVTVTDPNASRWGFELTIIDRQDQAAGVLINTDPGHVQASSLQGRDFLKHNSSGTYPGTGGSASWTMDWKAPVGGPQRVELYVAGVGSNNALGPSGDQVYLAAQASVEDTANAPSLSLQLHPATELPRQGSSWQVFAELSNHEAFAQTVTVAPRLRLPSGATYPASGWLGPPQTVTVPALGHARVTFTHAIPAGAPQMSLDYEALMGFAPSTLVDQRSFPFTVIP